MMKRVLLVLLFLLFSSEIQAQTVTLIVQWDPNPATEAVISYQVVLTSPANPSIPPQTIQSTVCSPSICQATFTNVGLGTYTASVTATNEWGTGPAGTGTLSIQIPVVVKNIKGKKG